MQASYKMYISRNQLLLLLSLLNANIVCFSYFMQFIIFVIFVIHFLCIGHIN